MKRVALCLIAAFALHTFALAATDGYDDMPEGLPILVEVESITVPPKLIHAVQPHYPTKAAEHDTEGKVIIKALIDTKGRVKTAQVLKSSNPIFNKPALEAVKQYKFTPAMRGKEKVEVYVKIPVVFKK